MQDPALAQPEQKGGHFRVRDSPSLMLQANYAVADELPAQAAEAVVLTASSLRTISVFMICSFQGYSLLCQRLFETNILGASNEDPICWEFLRCVGIYRVRGSKHLEIAADTMQNN